jgi:hypothetical protein
MWMMREPVATDTFTISGIFSSSGGVEPVSDHGVLLAVVRVRNEHGTRYRDMSMGPFVTVDDERLFGSASDD